MTVSERIVTGTLYVENTEHSVKCVVKSTQLCIEVQNMKSGEMWKCASSPDYLENITSKTGSYKQYATFVDMLCDAAQSNSDSVELELLTYNDLVALKTGKQSSKRSSDNKRYLILIYKVQYDTVHYPLPLQYAGKMGTAELQQNVTKLQREIDRLKEQIVSVPGTSPACKQAPVLHQACCQDNAALTREIQSLREQCSAGKDAAPSTVRNLQNALRNLENDMIREKNKYQRALDKKSTECRRLVEEVEKLRVENRTLNVKLRNVTTELNLSKRSNSSRISSYSNRSTPHSNPRAPRPRSAPLHSSQYNRSGSRKERARSTSADRSRDYLRSNSREFVRSNSRGSYSSSRNSSKERTKQRDKVDKVYSRKRSTSRNSNRSDSNSEIRTRARTPSPAGARHPRFDPSAYVKDKQNKLQEKARIREREVKSRTYQPRARSTPVERASPASSIYHKPPTSSIVKDIIANNILHARRCSGSVSSLDSYNSNHSNNSNRGNSRAASKNAAAARPKKKLRSKYSYPSSCSDSDYKENRSRDKENRRRSPYINSSPAVDLSLEKSRDNVSRSRDMSFTKDSEIAEIDARLNALQTYLKDAKNRQYVA